MKLKEFFNNFGTILKSAFQSPKGNVQYPSKTMPNSNTVNAVHASTFADPADVAAFRKYYARFRAAGLSDAAATRAAFKHGDNALGCWGDSTAAGSGPSCALPPEDWKPLGKAARFAKVLVRANGKSVVCSLKDTMPHRENITNGAGIDLNPDACEALGIHPPAMVPATWQFV